MDSIWRGAVGTGAWYYTSNNWSRAQTAPLPYADDYYANLRKDGRQSLFQVTSFPLGGPGPVELSFFVNYALSDERATTVGLYGSATQPTFGSWGSWGTAIGTYSFTGSTTGSTTGSSWLKWDSTSWSATASYSWYTIVFTGHTSPNTIDNPYFGVDAVSLSVTPVPISPTVYLLGSGLIALVVIRRRHKN